MTTTSRHAYKITCVLTGSSSACFKINKVEQLATLKIITEPKIIQKKKIIWKS